MNDKLLAIYDQIPEWIRWILFIPACIVFALLISALVSLFFATLKYGPGGGKGWFSFVEVILAHALFYGGLIWLIYYIIPRWKINAVLFMVIIRLIASVALLIWPIYYYHDILLNNLEGFLWIYFQGFLSELATAFIAIYSYLVIKRLENG